MLLIRTGFSLIKRHHFVFVRVSLIDRELAASFPAVNLYHMIAGACFEGDKWHHVTVRCSDKDEKDMRMWARGLIPYEKARKKFGFRYPGLPHTYYGMRPEYGNGKF